MKKTIFQRAVLITFIGLLHISLSFGQSAKTHDEPKPQPIELSQITLAYAIQDDEGAIVWETPKRDAPNTIPAGATKLRFTAMVNNRPKNSRIRLRAILQETCPSPDTDKPFLAGLRHLTETDPTGQQTGDTSDDEMQVIDANGRVTIELSVHCEDCVRAACGRECSGRDHLGEGPHVITLTTTDLTTEPKTSQKKQKRSTDIAKPSSWRVDIMSVCPKEERKSPAAEKSSRF
jgi:hypothetical protein